MKSIAIIGTPIKVYRRHRCINCGECCEFDIRNISEDCEKITIICPYCNAEEQVVERYLPNVDDRSVRCD